jgi:hypothetical protein
MVAGSDMIFRSGDTSSKLKVCALVGMGDDMYYAASAAIFWAFFSTSSIVPTM